MRCEDLNQDLVAGGFLEGEAQEHVSQCSSCQAFASALASAPEQFPETRTVEAIQKRLRESLTPVRPLPSDGVLIARLVSLFAILALFLVPIVHANGILLQPVLTRTAVLVAIGISAWVISLALVQLVVPAGKWRIHPVLALFLPVLLFGVVTALAFPSLNMTDWVKRGIACMRLGMVCAIPAAAAGALVLRRGYPTHRRTFAAVGGALAGLVGLTALEIHCMIFDMSHILVWHLGVMVVSALTAFLGAMLYERLRH